MKKMDNKGAAILAAFFILQILLGCWGVANSKSPAVFPDVDVPSMDTYNEHVGDFKTYTSNNPTGSGGTSAFIGLADTPGSYAGQAGRYPRVNPGETGLEFTTIGGGGTPAWGNITSDIADQTDLQSALSGKADAGHDHSPFWQFFEMIPENATDTFGGLSVTTTGVTVRTELVVPKDADEVRPVMFSGYSTPVTVYGAHIAYPNVSGGLDTEPVVVTYKGETSWTAPPNTRLELDPVPVSVVRGDVLAVTGYIDGPCYGLNGHFKSWYETGDQLAKTGPLANEAGTVDGVYYNITFLGLAVPTPKPAPIVKTIGDSEVNGVTLTRAEALDTFNGLLAEDFSVATLGHAGWGPRDLFPIFHRTLYPKCYPDATNIVAFVRVSTNYYIADMSSMVGVSASIKSTGQRLVHATIPPLPVSWMADRHPLRRAYNDWLRSLPAGADGIVDFASWMSDPADEDAILPGVVDPTDLTHYTPYGHSLAHSAIINPSGASIKALLLDAAVGFKGPMNVYIGGPGTMNGITWGTPGIDRDGTADKPFLNAKEAQENIPPITNSVYNFYYAPGVCHEQIDISGLTGPGFNFYGAMTTIVPGAVTRAQSTFPLMSTTLWDTSKTWTAGAYDNKFVSYSTGSLGWRTSRIIGTRTSHLVLSGVMLATPAVGAPYKIVEGRTDINGAGVNSNNFYVGAGQGNVTFTGFRLHSSTLWAVQVALGAAAELYTLDIKSGAKSVEFSNAQRGRIEACVMASALINSCSIVSSPVDIVNNEFNKTLYDVGGSDVDPVNVSIIGNRFHVPAGGTGYYSYLTSKRNAIKANLFEGDGGASTGVYLDGANIRFTRRNLLKGLLNGIVVQGGSFILAAPGGDPKSVIDSTVTYGLVINPGGFTRWFSDNSIITNDATNPILNNWTSFNYSK